MCVSIFTNKWVVCGLDCKEKEKLTLFIGNIIRNLEKIHIAKGNSHVLGLSASETTRKVRVAKHACRATAVHGLGSRVGIGLFALRRQFLFAKEAFAAGDLERCHVSLSNFNPFDIGPDLLSHAAEFVSEDVALVELDDGAVQQVKV